MTSYGDEWLEIIEQLRSTNSKLEKTRILVDSKDVEGWQDYLVSVYNPFILYGESGDKNYGQDNLENLKLCRSLNAGVTEVTITRSILG